MPTYLEVEYPKINRRYVRELTRYIVKRFFTATGRLLDVGSGTGDYVYFFSPFFRQTEGLDVPFDLENEYFPYPDNHFDYVFSKSTLEHITNTQHVLLETGRVLASGGVVVFMVPDWNSQWKSFYDDSTHVKPFTKKGLMQAFQLAGFRDIKCEYFYQLPFTWRHGWLRFVPHILDLVPYGWRMCCKLLRFSNERMLLLRARR